MQKPKYRLIAIDLDGTLLDAAGKVAASTREAIQRTLQAGARICFATGRNWTESREIMDAVGHHDLAVFVGGAMVVDAKRGVTLHRSLMDPQLAREVCGAIEDAGHAVLALQDTSHTGVDYLISAEIPLNEASSIWMKVTRAIVQPVTDLRHRPHDHTIRAGIVAPAEEIDRVWQILEHGFGGRVFIHRIHVPAYGVQVMEVFDPSVNKWEGILHVARKLQIDPKQIIAIGDDVNDIAMLKNAGLSVAMGNARPEIQQLAHRVIGKNTEDGLAKFLDEIVASGLLQKSTDTPPSQDVSAKESEWAA
jgi:Cof subfamily protein (haloacid dehalogenase superfamily)